MLMSSMESGGHQAIMSFMEAVGDGATRSFMKTAGGRVNFPTSGDQEHLPKEVERDIRLHLPGGC